MPDQTQTRKPSSEEIEAALKLIEWYSGLPSQLHVLERLSVLMCLGCLLWVTGADGITHGKFEEMLQRIRAYKGLHDRASKAGDN